MQGRYEELVRPGECLPNSTPKFVADADDPDLSYAEPNADAGLTWIKVRGISWP